MAEAGTTLALVAIVGSVITALFKLLNDNSKALIRVAEATEQGAQEAKERNGHLGEQTAIVAEIGRKNNTMTAKILNRLEKSETALEKNTKKVAEKVEHVKTDLEDSQ